ncbi:PepSY domain-containing protein [Futiania mangrovi]|uniref:PepSY domain-containing protein n=1 Tax=Futiania mangrovi TaxID=2959716 RepID=A0A9J6P8X6_9PROT|nr:PepSY domain-containing protein [Futiania mangrovii]MCP1335117.1 PepSY domain-containing protein [Futiania mangrovii]
MKTTLVIATLVAAAAGTGAAFASDKCDVPMSEWQPREALQKKLEEQGWQVRKIKTDDGCYEAYAIDDKGQRVEAYFNPKTFEMVKSKKDD